MSSLKGSTSMSVLKRIISILKEKAAAQKGFTAIQTAIGLVAAVTAAGALTTVVLIGGTEASQEAEQNMYAALEGIQGTFILKGPLYGMAVAAGPEACISQIAFNVGLVMDEGFTDFTPPVASPENNGLAGPGSRNAIVISYTDEYQHIENLYWTVTPLGKDDGDLVLECGELFHITLGGALHPGQAGGNLIDALEFDLTGDRAFNIGICVPQGVFMYLDGRTPSQINRVNVFR
jgi:hypothetical protein